MKERVRVAKDLPSSTHSPARAIAMAAAFAALAAACWASSWPAWAVQDVCERSEGMGKSGLREEGAGRRGLTECGVQTPSPPSSPPPVQKGTHPVDDWPRIPADAPGDQRPTPCDDRRPRLRLLQGVGHASCPEQRMSPRRRCPPAARRHGP